jgi:hypothetical protein
MEKSVDLRAAFAWTCDNCGKDNYCEGIIPDVKEVMPEMPEEMNTQEIKGAWVMIPSKVKCNNCKAIFIAIPLGMSSREEEEEEEEEENV